MTKKTQHANSEGFSAKFDWKFLAPRYWFIWLIFFLLILISFIPPKIRDPLLAKLGKIISKKAKNARNRARANLAYCFPEKSVKAREGIIDNMFATILPVILLLVQLVVRGNLNKRVIWHGLEHVNASKDAGRNIIFMVPHSWAIDISGLLLFSQGYQVAAFFNHQSNALIDWFWNRARLRFGGRIHSRDSGIKPFIKSIREGYCGYYLPDEDHGIEQSVFVDFFATYKATLPVLKRLSAVSHADVIPLFPVYDMKNATLHIYINEKMPDFKDMDDEAAARAMNVVVEYFVKQFPEQYTWTLRFLKTRKEGDASPYDMKFDD